MLENVNVLYHSSIKFSKGKVIYIDPYNIDKDYNDADFIFITHSHYDHFSEEDINKVKKGDTIIIEPKDLYSKTQNIGFATENILVVEPHNEYTTNGLRFSTVPAYNINKGFHQKSNDWVGYIIELEGILYYIAGDTDMTEDNRKVKCDVAFVPVGGTFTMDYEEAARLVNEIKPKIAIPIHYGSIVGTKQDAINFVNSLNPEIKGEILLK